MKNFCGNCGQRIDKRTGLCPQCDKATLDAMKKKRKIMIYIMVTLGVVAVVIIGAWLVMKKSNHETSADADEHNVYDIYGNYNSFMEGFTDVRVTDEETAIEAVDSVAHSLGINNAKEELKVSSTQSVKEDTFYRMQQYYNGILVYGRSVVVSANDDGKTTALTSNYKRISEEIDLNPTVTQTDIEKSIRKYFDLDDIQITDISESNLVIYNLDDKESVLAYYLTINGVGSVIVNAKTAEIIHYNSIVSDVVTTVKSKDGKTTAIGWQDDDGNYQLYNDEHKIEVFDVDGVNTVVGGGGVYTDFRYYGVETISSKNNEFDMNAVILLNDVINLSEYYSDLGHDGFDQVHVAINDSYDNGRNARGGGGNINGIDCAIMLMGTEFNFADKDVVAHEYTHAVTGLLVDWGGNSIQNDALNEAYSDIFGTLYENPENPDWEMEHLSRVLRDLSNPSKTNSFDCMSDIEKLGKYSEYTLSTIVSHAAYLMWNGIDGSEDGKIDAETLSEMWYQSVLLLQSDADFGQCRNAVELSARMMLNNGEITEEQYKTVVTAFEKAEIENAVYSFSETVKNQFDLLVLSGENTENVQFKLEVIRLAENGGTDKKPSELILMKDAISGRQTMELEDGTYVFRITDVNNEKSIAQSINLRIVVNGESEMSSDEVIVNTDFAEVIIGEKTPEEESEISDSIINELKETLIEEYGLSSQEQFVSCLGTEFQVYPSEIEGIISMTEIDIDNDGRNEIIVLRAIRTENNLGATILTEMYQYKDDAFMLTASKTIHDVSFCSAANIYLFYSQALEQYCIMVDSDMIGSYTGVNSWYATIYTVSNETIEQYKSMEFVPYVATEVDFESEFAKIGVPYAKYCTEYNKLSDGTYYQQLCEVEHEIFGDSSTYDTRNHRLRIIGPNASDNTQEANIWATLPREFTFTSGAGAWATGIEINDDGTFTGAFHDSNMGEAGAEYPNGTVYVCNFKGKFSTPKKVNEYVYSMKLEELTVEDIPGEVLYEDGFKYIYADPYGFDDADEFYIYMPGTPITDVEKGFLDWSRAFFDINAIQQLPEGVYGIYNIGGEQGFVATDGYEW